MTKFVLPASRDLSPHYKLGGVDRRTLIVGGLVATPVALAGSTLLWATRSSAAGEGSKVVAPTEFLALSQILVGARQLDATLATPAWAALVLREKDFPARFTALHKAIEAAGLRDMTQWSASSVAADPALKATAVAIVSAWYLGVVGAVQDRGDNGPAFITYTGALMWAPTIDVTVIPTYARGRPGFWAAKPVTTIKT